MAYPYDSPFRLTSGFRTAARPDHHGIDLVGVDKHICAIVGGTVGASAMVTDKNNLTWQWGNYVRIDGDDGKHYFYCHMSKRLVQAGQRVEAGSWVGIEGSTGYSSGSHLHLEVRSGNGSATAVNPADLLGIRNAVGTYGEDYRTLCARRFGLDDNTMRYLDGHPFPHALYRKLAKG